MIKITRKEGTKTAVIEVTNGAYESIYRKQGWVPFEVNHPAAARHPSIEGNNSPPVEGVGGGQKSGDELFLENIELKPISTWTKNEQKRYAKLKGLDQNAEDLRELIKEHVDGRE
jgi:hypothetical protein